MATTLPHVYSFRELMVYRKSRQVARSVFALTQRFPKDETYSLTDQIPRSSRSIGANIAEAWGKRGYERHFVSKLTDAHAEQLETQHWLEVALDCGYVASEEVCSLLEDCSEIGRMLGGMIARADSFCNPGAIREPSVEYFTDSSADSALN